MKKWYLPCFQSSRGVKNLEFFKKKFKFDHKKKIMKKKIFTIFPKVQEASNPRILKKSLKSIIKKNKKNKMTNKKK